MEPQITSMQPDFFVFSKNISVPLFCVITHAKITLYAVKTKKFMAGILFIVPTPVGNLEDMTLRAVRVLKEADLILAEDTRTTSVLLKHFDIHRPLQSHHKYNEHQTVELVKERILGGLNVALVSDAGTPGISDPGFLLARTCAEEGIEVQTLPGATACIPAIVSSGLPCDRFVFEGFLPQKKGRQTLLQSLAEETRTMVFYESPYRLVKTLEQFVQYFGPERRCSVAREISKLHEEHKRGTLSEVAAWFREHEPKGEIVIVVAGAQPVKASKQKRYGRGEEETEQP
jgi:16S rRNA (cytidine1402-2'-O)-methyltransferase